MEELRIGILPRASHWNRNVRLEERTCKKVC